MNNKVILKITSSMLLCTMFAYTSPVFALTKEETVYSKLDSNGSSYNTIVNNHLINDSREKLINDLSNLVNIENVNGDEKFEQNGSNLVWDANGADIYYQGESTKDLPIECSVSYELNGQKISSKDLAGKSGTVKIILEYKNKDEHFVNINGKSEKLYTPFVVVCGTIIDNKDNRNIKITSGKVIDDGSKTTVIGMCFPGLQESLNVSKDKLDIPNKVEISMEATNFELNNIATFVTPKILEENDLTLFEKLDDVYSKVNTLQSSSKQLEAGANTLKEGAVTYSEKSHEFNSAMKQVSAGVSSASSSYSKIDNGISLLNKNSKTLEAGAKSVNDGTKAVSSNLKIISGKIGELQAGTKGLQEGEKQLNAGLDKIIAGVSGISVADNSAKIAELEQLVKANENTIKTLKNTNSNLNSQLNSLGSGKSSSTYKEGSVAGVSNDDTIAKTKESIKAQISANNSLISLLETNVKATKATILTLKNTDVSAINELSNGLSSLKEGVKSIKSGTDSIYAGQTALKEGIDILASKTDELSQGSTALYEGTVKVAEGTKTLNSGSAEMKNGLKVLDNGANTLTSANNQLTDGAGTLSAGATALAEGISKFNSEGIQTICNYINGDLKNISVRLEKLQELANEYNNFTMLSDGSNGIVKFIMIMDSIKNEESSKDDVILPNNEDLLKEEQN